MGDVIDNTLHQAQIKSTYEQYARGAHGMGIVERKIRRKNERLMIQHFGFILGDHARLYVLLRAISCREHAVVWDTKW